MQDELLSVVDENDQIIGSQSRYEIHQLGLRHRATHVLIFNERDELFLQHRSIGKDINAGLWDSSAAGHVDIGEAYVMCALREIQEELGVTIEAPLELLFKLPATIENGMEFIEVYRCEHNGPFTLAADEIDEGYWFPSETISTRVANNDFQLTETFKNIWKQYLNKDDRALSLQESPAQQIKKKTSVSLQKLQKFYHDLLSPDNFSDYCPNGLQIEGKESISKIAFAVSATKYSIEQAINFEADSLVVHHGLFWNFHPPKTLTGSFAKRIIPLVRNEINLLAYHLPLDAQLDMGNAAVIAKLLGCQQLQKFGDYKGSPTGVKAFFTKPISAANLQKKLQSLLKHNVLLASPNKEALIKTLGIITGGANKDWRLAQQQGLDAYITGEMSEHDWHESLEEGIHLFAGGHNATEELGIKALMKYTQQKFKIDCVFIGSDNLA